MGGALRTTRPTKMTIRKPGRAACPRKAAQAGAQIAARTQVLETVFTKASAVGTGVTIVATGFSLGARAYMPLVWQQFKFSLGNKGSVLCQDVFLGFFFGRWFPVS